MSDRIILEGIEAYGRHGVHPAERELGQLFRVDLSVGLSLQAAGSMDDLEKTLNYVELAAIVRRVVEGESRRLIEAVAEQIAKQVLALGVVSWVQVRVYKPHVPDPALRGRVSVEITREA